MLNLDWSIIWTIVNLLILFVLLRIFLFKPITKMMESRTAEIENGLKDAAEKNALAEEKCAEYDKRLDSAHVQAGQIVADAQGRGQQEYERILKDAQVDAQKALEHGRRQMALEREQILQQAKDGMADVVLLTAAKLSEKEMDDITNRHFVDSFLSEVGVASSGAGASRPGTGAAE